MGSDSIYLSIISGAKGYSLKNTVINSALWGGFVGALAGLQLMIVGAVITTPIGAAIGAAEGFVGYKIGSFLCDD